MLTGPPPKFHGTWDILGIDAEPDQIEKWPANVAARIREAHAEC